MPYEKLADLPEKINVQSSALRAIRERADALPHWGWKEGALVDQETLEPVPVQPVDVETIHEGPHEYVVFLPSDVKYALQKLSELSTQYDELYAFAAELEQNAEAES